MTDTRLADLARRAYNIVYFQADMCAPVAGPSVAVVLEVLIRQEEQREALTGGTR
jgi:hypothetical protein